MKWERAHLDEHALCGAQGYSQGIDCRVVIILCLFDNILDAPGARHWVRHCCLVMIMMMAIMIMMIMTMMLVVVVNACRRSRRRNWILDALA